MHRAINSVPLSRYCKHKVQVILQTTIKKFWECWGLLVGAAVGCGVSDVVGEGVGETVGFDEGAGVGDTVGALEEHDERVMGVARGILAY